MTPGLDGGAGQAVGHVQVALARDPVLSAAVRRGASVGDCLARTHAILSQSTSLITHSRDAIARSQALLNRTAPR
jgi:hypothetical protein